MKKFSIIMSLVALVLGFTACENDTEPVFQKPTDFKLNTPALADQYYELTPEGTIVLTCSQPDYGFTASTTYGVQVALSPNGEVYDIAPEVPTSAVLRVKAADVATAMCVLRGIDDADKWDDADAMPVYIRATAQLGTHGESFIASNWITLKQVKGYFAVPTPGFIYLIGQPGGWTGPDAANADKLADWRLFEKRDNIGSKVYYGVFDIPAGQAMFRFYTQLTGWDTDSWGSQVEDNPMDFTMNDGSQGVKIMPGKGAFNFTDWQGGEMTIIVDLNAANPKLTVLAGNQL